MSKRHIYWTAVSLIIASASSVCAEGIPIGTTGEFQMIVLQNDGDLTGINIAVGQGEDVRFFSNVETLDIEWNEEGGAIKTGTFASENASSVVLGVCAGGNCQVSGGLSFTTPVGIVND
jgi:hypothetical protein